METFKAIIEIIGIIIGFVMIIYSIFNKDKDGVTLNNLYYLILGGIILLTYS